MTEYYDPKNEPGGEKKLLLALLLVVVGVAVMQYLVPKPAPPPVEPKPAIQTQQATPTPLPTPAPAKPQPRAATGTNTIGTKKSQIEAAQCAATQATNDQQTTVIENQYYRIAFSNRGALVKSWILKKYKNDKGQELDLVNPVTAPVMGYPLSLFTYSADLRNKINEAAFVPSAVGMQTAPASISFDWSDCQTTVHKKFTFLPDKYVVGIETQVTENGNTVPAFPQWPGGFGDQTVLSSYGGSRIDWEQDDKVTRKPPQSGWFLTGKSWVVGGQTINGPFEWVAALDQYFVAAFMPDSPKETALVTFHEQVEIPRNLDKPEEGGKDKASVLGVAVGNPAGGLTRERLFVGPKAVDLLDSVQAQPGGPDLHGVLDFGWFGFIARPLFLWLKWTHEHWVRNWGWAIAFLTIVINAALLPLRISSMKSSLKMQKIQPQVKIINEKYKRYSITDPRRAQMQQEMSALYKKEGVNPVGGCFPMLLQMPFLFAFYSMLGNAIELRQATWLWIHDLSSADPIHLLPILIMISMLLSSKSMPQGGMDPTQQKIMQVFTPVMMGLISWNLAAGLGVYWALTNVIMWVQQLLINRTEFGKQVRKSVEKRAMRKR